MSTGTAAKILGTAQELTGGDAGSGDIGILTLNEIPRREDTAQVEAELRNGGALLVVTGPNLALHLAAHTLERGSGDHSFGGTANAHEDVGRRVLNGGHNPGADITVQNQFDAGTRLADLLDQVFVAGTIQHDDGHIFDLLAERTGHCAHVVGDRGIDINHALGAFTNGELVHIGDTLPVVQGTPFGDGDHRDGPRHPLGEQGRAFNGINGDIHLGAITSTDALAGVEHRGLVLFTLADDDEAVHWYTVERVAHRINSGLIGTNLIPTAHPTRTA